MANDDTVTMRAGRVTVTGTNIVGGSVRAAVPSATRDAGAAGDALLRMVSEQFDLDEAVEIEAEIPSGATRGTGGAPSLRVDVDVEATRHPVLLLQDVDNGLWSWVLPRRPASRTRGTSAAGPTSFEVPLDDARRSSERGVASAIAKKVIRVLVDKAGSSVSGRAGKALAERWERERRPAGLRWFSADTYRTANPGGRFAPADASRLAAGRSLLFIHGTMSLSHSGFHRLPPATMHALDEAYQGRVWAYDHPTLSTSPTENASWLVRELAEHRRPDDPLWDVDIVAHSRGGLVARELVERPPSGMPFAARNVVFFATPNNGTPLCSSEHLDRFVSHHTNLLTLLPDNAVTDALDGVITLVKQIVLTMYDGIPGVRAMEPGGDYLRALNSGGPPDDVTYRAVASDYEPSDLAGVAGRLRDLAVDSAFGGEANDLIVPTDSVSHAGDRVLVPPERCHLFGPADAIDHSGYWDAPVIASQLVDIIAGTATWDGVSTTTRGFPAVITKPRAARTVTSDDAKIEISVVHGSLEYAHYPVMVGHFEGATLKGAEEFVDDRLDGLLSGRQMVGQYPQQPGEAIFLRPRRRPETAKPGVEDALFPPGAYVLGLGPSGELTRSKLILSVKAALVDRGIELYEQAHRRDELVEFGVASVLVGAFPVDGLTVETSLVAIVEGVLAANETFRRFELAAAHTQRHAPRVRVTALEVIERYADRAELAAHAVRVLPRLLDRIEGLEDLIEKTDVVIERRDGGLPYRPPLEEAETSWRRVLVTMSDAQRAKLEAKDSAAPSSLELDVTVLGRLARADRLRHVIDCHTVDNLVAAAITDATPDAQVANTLWELFLPVDLKDGLIAAGRIQLVVDELTANYPWEVMRSRGVQGVGAPLSLARAGLLRQFREGGGGQRIRARRASEDGVLVVGNPPVLPTDYPWMTDRYPSLPGATAEAVRVRDVLREGGFGVTPLIWDAGGYQPGAGDDLDRDAGSNSGRAVVNALFKADYRIVHVAAHGTVDHDPAESGAVIGGGMLLTANVVRQLPVVPDIVFLNCCHLAKVGFNRLAAGIARELLAIGVQVVVAAGWAVDDHAAEGFAEAFYRSLLSGRDFGDAVREARTAAHERSDSLTWGAYQCYGDPGYRLTLRGGWSDTPDFEPVSRDELRREVRGVGVLAAEVGVPDAGELERRRHRLVDQLDRLATSAPPAWLDAEVGYELARAYGELGHFEQAVHWYRTARDRGPMHPAVLLEQLASLEIRLAQQRGADRDPSATPLVTDRPAELVRAARRHVKAARALGDTAERKAIEASLDKKEATLTPPGAARAALVAKAAAAYEDAHRINLQLTAGDTSVARDPYPALSWLQMASLATTWPPADTALEQTFQEVRDWLDEHQPPVLHQRHDLRITPGFWEVARVGDLALTAMLVTPAGRGITRPAITRVAQAYVLAFMSRSSWGNRSFVLDHLRDLSTLAEGRDALVAAIGEVIDRLEAWQDENIQPPSDPEAIRGTAGPPRSARRRAGTRVSVEMLPAAHGDCLWIEYGVPRDIHRILVDGGPAETYPAGLGDRLIHLPDDDRRFDLLVVTHIDTDHIDGGLRALRERNVTFDDIWFNGWKHLGGGTDRGPVQGAILDALLAGRQWNGAFDAKSVVVPSDGPALPSVALPGGAVITLLSPGPAQLESLGSTWRSTLEKQHIRPGSAEDALRILDERTEYEPLERDATTKKGFGNDGTPANGSSIAFLFEIGGRSCLFGADAHAPVLADSLRRLVAERRVERLPLDIFKLPHHGSRANVSEELLALVDCDRFLVSTNGAKFHHPDPETIELIGRHRTARSVVCFNYLSDTTGRWQSAEQQEKANIVARYPDTGAGLVVKL